MARSRDRFRRLRAQQPAERPTQARAHGRSTTPAGETADLFEHFGVDVGATSPKPGISAVHEACSCRSCGWFVRVEQAALGCPVCTEPDPSGELSTAPP